MDKFIVVNKDGSVETVPVLIFSTNQLGIGIYLAIGTDFYGDRDYKIDTGMNNSTAKCLGKYSEQDMPSLVGFRTSMQSLHWDFDKYPDPELIQIIFNNAHFN